MKVNYVLIGPFLLLLFFLQGKIKKNAHCINKKWEKKRNGHTKKKSKIVKNSKNSKINIYINKHI